MRFRAVAWLFILFLLVPAGASQTDRTRWVLLLASRSGVVEAVDPATLETIGTMRLGSMVDWVSALPDGRTLVVATNPPESQGCCALYSLDLDSRAMVPLLYPAMRGILSADGHQLFAQRGNVGIDTIDMLTLTRGTTFGPLGKSYYLQASPFRRWLFGVSNVAAPTLDLFDLKNNAIVRSMALPRGQRVIGAWSGKEYSLLGYANGKGTLWSVKPEATGLGAGQKVDLHELGGDCRIPNSKATEPLMLEGPVAAGGKLFVYEGFGYKFDRRECSPAPSGGVYVIDPGSGTVTAHLATSLFFMRLVANCDGTELIGIEVGPRMDKPSRRLVRLDAKTGKILATRDLNTGMVVYETLALLYDSVIPHGEVRASIAERPRWLSACAATKPSLDEPARDPKASPFGFGEWYISEDREIWFPRQDWRAGQGNKVILIRPAGIRLDITGKRTDGEAPRVHLGPKDFASDYPGSTFEVIGLTFPTEGCWDMTVKAGDDTLRFLTTVRPASKALTASRARD